MKLLVSARNLDEAIQAANAGVDIVDLKEPLHGSLAAVSIETAESVRDHLNGSVALSLAMGELGDWSSDDPVNEVLNGFQFAKIGLANCDETRSDAGKPQSDWKDRWIEWAEVVGRYASPVLASYADDKACSAPSLETIVQFACELSSSSTTTFQIQTFLIDTFKKDGRSLFDHFSVNKLSRQLQPLFDNGIVLALAGSLKESDIPGLLAVKPDIVAVRGAVCRKGKREDMLDPLLIKKLLTMVKAGESDWLVGIK